MSSFEKKMSIMEALKKHPGARDVFVKYGLGCLACMGAVAESVESGARMHGVNPDLLIADLNGLLAEGKDKNKA
jgi:hybrid cluster-associated redox disulfide protein